MPYNTLKPISVNQNECEGVDLLFHVSKKTLLHFPEEISLLLTNSYYLKKKKSQSTSFLIVNVFHCNKNKQKMAERKVNLKHSLLDKSQIQKLDHLLVTTHFIFLFSTQQLPRVMAYGLHISTLVK